MTDAEKMSAMRAAGYSMSHIATVFLCSPTKVRYCTDPEFARRRRARNAAEKDRTGPRRAYRHSSIPDPHATVDKSTWDAHDDSAPVWIEDRTIAPQSHKARRHRGRPEPDPPEVVKDHRSAIERATDLYLAGDREALRVYLDSVGR